MLCERGRRSGKINHTNMVEQWSRERLGHQEVVHVPAMEKGGKRMGEKEI
jgi:hypothetical protein